VFFYSGTLGEQQILLKPDGGENPVEVVQLRVRLLSLGTLSFVPPFLGKLNDITPILPIQRSQGT
jgi:hypothetical protein